MDSGDEDDTNEGWRQRERRRHERLLQKIKTVFPENEFEIVMRRNLFQISRPALEPIDADEETSEYDDGGGENDSLVSDDRCLVLSIDRVGVDLDDSDDDGDSEDDRHSIYVDRLWKCRGYHGRRLLGLLDALAAAIRAVAIRLEDASFKILGDPRNDCRIDLAVFHILGTGQSYYNQFGYSSISGDAEDRRHNAALIDGESFGATLRGFVEQWRGTPPKKRSFLPEERLRLLDTWEFLPNKFCPRGMVCDRASTGFDTHTTREIFQIIHASRRLEEMKSCNDDDTKWLDSVLFMFTLKNGDGIRYRDPHLIKRFDWPSAPTPPATPPPPPRLGGVKRKMPSSGGGGSARRKGGGRTRRRRFSRRKTTLRRMTATRQRHRR